MKQWALCSSLTFFIAAGYYDIEPIYNEPRNNEKEDIVNRFPFLFPIVMTTQAVHPRLESMQPTSSQQWQKSYVSWMHHMGPDQIILKCSCFSAGQFRKFINMHNVRTSTFEDAMIIPLFTVTMLYYISCISILFTTTLHLLMSGSLASTQIFMQREISRFCGTDLGIPSDSNGHSLNQCKTRICCQSEAWHPWWNV